MARFCQRPKPGDQSHPASYTLCSYITSHSKQWGREEGKDKESVARMQRRGQGLGRVQRRAEASTSWADSQRKTWLRGPRSSQGLLSQSAETVGCKAGLRTLRGGGSEGLMVKGKGEPGWKLFYSQLLGPGEGQSSGPGKAELCPVPPTFSPWVLACSGPGS